MTFCTSTVALTKRLPPSARNIPYFCSARATVRAASLGSLSLMLRKAGETTSPKSLRVSLKDLFSDVVAEMGAVHSTTTITIKGGTGKEDYSVPIEGKEQRASANSETGQAVH